MSRAGWERKTTPERKERARKAEETRKRNLETMKREAVREALEGRAGAPVVYVASPAASSAHAPRKAFGSALRGRAKAP